MMSENVENKDDVEMATLNKITPPTEPPMRIRAKYATVVVVVVAALALFARYVEEPLDVYRQIDDLHFADAALDECVHSVAKTQGWTDVGVFVGLRCNNPSGDGVRSLAGIEHLVELTEVNLAFNRISDIGPLAQLPNVAVLDLSHNMVKQLPVLNFAPALKRMDLNYNFMESIDWLAEQHFPVLDSLSFAHNSISDLTALQSNASIRELNVRNNRITSLQPILHLQGLVMLDVGDNLIDDISDLGMLAELRRLFLDGNRLSTLDGVQSLRKLEELDLENNALVSIAQISQLERLQRLNLDQTGISDLDDILALGDLELLRISANPELGCDSIAAAIREYGKAAIRTDQNCVPQIGN